MTPVPAQARPADLRYSPPSWRHSPLRTAAARHIRGLYAGYRDDRPQAVATLARLRRGLGQPLHAQPDLWGLIGFDSYQQELREAPPPSETMYWAKAATLDRAETALHLTLTLWALHQQSHRETPVHVGGWSLGRSVRHLMRTKTAGKGADLAGTDGTGTTSRKADVEIDEPLRKRFVRIAAATSLDVMAQRLRELVLLLRTAGLPLDYGLLADQLLRWQEPDGPAEVHRFWGRDFHLAGMDRPPATESREHQDAAPETAGTVTERLPSAD
ncbi:type I-E CRISPR-associated protein Cse2/CasB [Streptomyces marincola]|uniref:type I-E CRISPR-associated protein Cse2/CasB n=1 Tax=Streptomyces marincola TaxID=2878388 RepID=UPI001CF20446|nr:type I-E CRISPR-associated protein Cse2/CasB [Streptomyces marincola]UCM89733.1 type I-E CRISPR-associated protein Cse2/CasB [Streptomyces marincola]